jgi:hypothetical protein
MARPLIRACGFCTALLLAFLVLGCGDRQEQLVDVKGTVKRGGKPVPNLVVNFVPEKGPPAMAVTDEQGQYKLLGVTGQEGVIVGNHKVFVKLKTARSKEDTEEQQRLATMRADPEIQAILQKYGNVDSTPLHYEIKNNQTIDIVLD